MNETNETNEMKKNNHTDKGQRDFEGLISDLKQLPEIDTPAFLQTRIMARVLNRKHRFRNYFGLKSFFKRPLGYGVATATITVFIAFFLYFSDSDIKQPLSMQDTDTIIITLKFDAPHARSVSLIGSFNNWTAEGYDMLAENGHSHWTYRLEVIPGTYEYAFLVNGEKVIPDPNALFNRPDGFGSYNSVIIADFNSNDKI